jgi:hypothetical protein
VDLGETLTSVAPVLAAGKAGFQTRSSDTSNSWVDDSQAYISWSHINSLPHYMGVKGSYLPSQSGSHRLYLRTPHLGTTVSISYTVDGTSLSVTGYGCTWGSDLTKSFRYGVQATYWLPLGDDTFLCIQVTDPTGSTGYINRTNGGETCYTSGCRDTALSREPYGCLPGPSVSLSPPVTNTPLPSNSQTNQFTHPVRIWPMKRTRLIRSAIFTWVSHV